MGDHTSFPFLMLPDVVTRNTFLPQLSLNTVLRLRLVSKAVKNIADAYLRVKMPSSNSIIISDEKSLNKFVRKDATSSIRYPATNLRLNIYMDQDENPDEYFKRILSYPGMNHLAAQYSAQITNLSIKCLKLPVKHDSPEFRFFQGFVNLNFLFVAQVYAPNENDDASTSTLPSSLRNLNRFGFRSYYTTRSDADSVWKFISQLGKLESFHFPQVAVLQDQPIPATEEGDEDSFVTIPAVAILPKFTELIKSGRNAELKVVTLNLMEISDYNREINAASQMQLKTNLVKFVKMCEQLKIKWKQIDAAWLQILDKQQLDRIAPFVLSIDCFKSDDLKGAVFPNLFSLSTYDIFEPIRDGTLSVTSVLERMSAAVFPNLRKLHITILSSKQDNALMARLWEQFPVLEDLKLGYHCMRDLSNEAFFGREVYPCEERKSLPCFLKLNGLKKLEIYLQEENLGVTDAVFFDVFRHMKLKEFQIYSYGPLKSITKNGIMALLTGPFVEANERFPFKNLKLKGMSNKEIMRLAREFPANQIL